MEERRLGNYVLVSQIATGGMAEIYLARVAAPTDRERLVALKVIHPNFSNDPEFVRMLVDEAKLSVQLEHPNIVHTFDMGRVGQQYYIAMELIDGPDLYRLLRTAADKERTFPVGLAAHIALCTASALHYAHEKNDPKGRPLQIVHRDVSPQNVLISVYGDVKLVDFGIAKAALRNQHTAAGVIKGKYYYMSPEQAWGAVVDRRSDVFSAGILLYEMLVGRMLYMKEDIHELLDMVRRAEIPLPSTHREGIPVELEAIVMRALAKRPEDRYQTADEFASALDQFLLNHEPAFERKELIAFVEEIIGDEHTVKGTNKSYQTAIHRSQVDFDDNSVLFNLEAAQRRRDKDEPTTAGTPMGFVSPKTDFTEADATFVDETRSRPAPPIKHDSAPFLSTKPISAQSTTKAFEQDQTKLDLTAPDLSEHTAPRDRISGAVPIARASGVHTTPLATNDSVPDMSPPTPTPRPQAARVTEKSGLAALPPLDLSSPTRFGWWVALTAGVAVFMFAVAFWISSERSSKISLYVRSDPSGAEVRLDGAALPSRTPLEVHGVDARHPHMLRLSLPGYDAWQTALHFEDVARDVHVQAVLIPVAGTLSVQSTPSGAELIINGRSSGITPMVVSELPPSENVDVELRLRGYKTVRRTLAWAGKRKLDIEIPLEKAD